MTSVTIRPHLPGFVDTPPSLPAVFTNLDELRLVPFVARWAAQPEFSRFTVHPYDGDPLLVAEMTSGEHWVIGYLSEYPFPGSEELKPPIGSA
jgi:hypothetical protein